MDDRLAKYNTANVEKVLHLYDLSYIPQPSIRHIKIFISSSHHEEFEYERKLLRSLVLPDLQNFCSQFGHDVEFIDMNEGSYQDPYYDSHLFEYSFQCINDCFLQSRGVFFIGLIGEKEGVIPIPAAISVPDMEVITEYIRNDDKKLSYITENYRENNETFPYYMLHELTKTASLYYKRTLSDEAKSDRNMWENTQNEIRHILRDVTTKAKKDEKLSYTFCHKSANMLHVEKAITLSQTSSNCQAILLLRENYKCSDPNLKQAIQNHPSAFFIKRPARINPDKTVFESKFVQDVIPAIKELIQASIQTSALTNLKIQDKGLKEVYKESLAHLDFWNTVVKAKVPTFAQNNDLLHAVKQLWGLADHATPSQNKNVTENNAESSRQRLIMENQGCPIILTGGEGVGKTCALSQILELVNEAYPRDQSHDRTVVLRFAGLTPKTVNMSQLLRGICLHLWYAINMSIKGKRQQPLETIFKDSQHFNTFNMFTLIGRFNDLLKTLGESDKNRHIFILIDDFHRIYQPSSWSMNSGNKQSINPDGNTGKMGTPGNTPTSPLKIFPQVLPSNIHIVLTMNLNKYINDPNSQDGQKLTSLLLDDLRLNFGSNTQILQIDTVNSRTLNPMFVQDIFLNAFKQAKIDQEPRWMQYYSTKTQRESVVNYPAAQKMVINQALLAGRIPLYATLLAQIAKDWSLRYKPEGINTLPLNIVLLIKTIFDKIDIQTEGTTLTYILRYISSSHIGITEIELLDILSCTKPLMEMYFPGVVTFDSRFPYFMWALIKKRLEPLLDHKIIDGKVLINWNHKVICNMAKMYSIQKPIEMTQTHCDMANLFLETIYLSKEANTSTLLPSTTIPLNFREITMQPLLFNEYQYNTRRIYELWYHLLYTGDLKLLKFHALCNFDYLMATLHGVSLGYLLYIFDKTLKRFLDYEIQTLCATLVKSVDILNKDHLQLACEIIGRLRNVDENAYPYLDNLVIQAMEWCDSYTQPLLVPLSSWLEISNPDLYDIFSLNDNTANLAILAPSSQHILVSSLKSNNIDMYHLASHEFIRSFKGIQGSVIALVISYNSSFVACATTENNISFWLIDKEDVHGTIRPNENQITTLLLSYDDRLIYSGYKDGRLAWSSTVNYQTIKLLLAHKGPVTGLVLNSFGEVLASSSEDKTIKLWLVENGTLLNSIEDTGFPIRMIKLSHDDIFLAVLCQEYHIQMRALTTGTYLYRLDHNKHIVDMCFTVDTRFLVLACKDYKIYLYNVTSQTLNHSLNGHFSLIKNVMVTMNNDYIVSTSQDSVYIWNIRKTMKQENVLTHKGIITCVKLTKDGSLGITGSEDGGVKVWNMEFSELQEKLPDHSKGITCVNFSPSGTYIVSGSKDTTINIKQLYEASSFIRFTGHSSSITNAVFSQDEKSIISSEVNDIVKVWRVDTGFTLLNCSVPSRVLMVSPNSLFAISGNRTNSMKIWNVEDGSLVNSITHSAEISCLSITTNSQICVTGSKDESLKVWEVTTGKLTQVLVGHEDAVTCVTTSHNNQKVISGSKDKTVIMWNIDTGSTLKTYADHSLEVTCVAITQDNSIIISSALDGTLRVWDSNKGTLITIFDCHYPVMNFSASPDASHILIRLNDPHVLLMCLHNSPASDYRATQSHSLDEVEHNENILPIKPKANRYSLYLGKNLIPKINTLNITDPTLSNVNTVMMSGIGDRTTGIMNTTNVVGPPTTKGAVKKTSAPKLLRKQDSMSKIFFQTHHPFPCSAKMSDLIPEISSDIKEKLSNVDSSGMVGGKPGTEMSSLLFGKNAKINPVLIQQCQANSLKNMTCVIQ